MIHIREFDGDPSRKQQQQGDAATAAAAASGLAFAEAEPQCLAHYVIPSATSGTDAGSSPDNIAATASRCKLSASSSIPTRTWKRIIHHRFVIMPQRVFSDLFLPLGYPESVSEGYLAYQFYDSLQGICSYLRGVVATSAVLMAAGVGDAEATAMSAAVSWALRDGTGMIGGLLFSYLASSQFDSHVKEFRLFADVINDVGLTLDMLAPFAGRGRVLYVTGLATICKTMCGMAAGATKGSITHHFAIHGNMADLNSKESTQETLVSLLGMCFGVVLARYLHALEKQGCDLSSGDDDKGEVECANGTVQTISWTIFIFLTLVHVWANYVGVKILRLRTLNRERTEVVLSKIIGDCANRCENAVVNSTGIEMPADELLLSTISTPHDVSESLWSSVCKLFFADGIHLGARCCDAFRGMNQIEISDTLKVFGKERYFVTVNRKNERSREVISVVLCAGSTKEDELKAFVHAMVLSALSKRISWSPDDVMLWKLYVVTTYQCIDKMFRPGDRNSANVGANTLLLGWLTKRGWETNRLYLGFSQYRTQVERGKEE